VTVTRIVTTGQRQVSMAWRHRRCVLTKRRLFEQILKDLGCFGGSDRDVGVCGACDGAKRNARLVGFYDGGSLQKRNYYLLLGIIGLSISSCYPLKNKTRKGKQSASLGRFLALARLFKWKNASRK
jgi:hypothetical protein